MVISINSYYIFVLYLLDNPPFPVNSTADTYIMSITVHEFDGITRQFRINPNEMPRMSTATMTPNYLSIKKFEQALRENALSISSYQTHLGHLSLVVSPEEYKEVSNNTPFVEPTNPGLQAASATTAREQIDSSRQFTFK